MEISRYQKAGSPNEPGQVLTRTHGKGQITRLFRNARALPTQLEEAMGKAIAYQYDNANRPPSAPQPFVLRQRPPAATEHTSMHSYNDAGAILDRY